MICCFKFIIRVQLGFRLRFTYMSSLSFIMIAGLDRWYGLIFKVFKFWKYAHWIIFCRMLLISS